MDEVIAVEDARVFAAINNVAVVTAVQKPRPAEAKDDFMMAAMNTAEVLSAGWDILRRFGTLDRYPCGFPSFDTSLGGGFLPGEFVVVLANDGEYEPLLDNLVRTNWSRRADIKVHRCPKFSVSQIPPGEKARHVSKWIRQLCGQVYQNGDLNIVIHPPIPREVTHRYGHPEVSGAGGNVMGFYANVQITAEVLSLDPWRVCYRIKKNKQYSGSGIMFPEIVVGWGPHGPIEYAGPGVEEKRFPELIA